MAKRKSKSQTSSAVQAKSRTKARREAREADRRKRRNLTYVIGLVVAAVVIAGIVLILSQPQDAPIPEGTFSRYEGIPQTLDEDGFPVLGDPDAPVRVIEYSSFSCPACRNWHESSLDDMLEQVRAGAVSFTFVPLQTGGVPNPAGAAKVALCAGEQGQFFEMHDALFDWQGRYGNRAFTQQRLDTGVANFELNQSQFDECRGSSEMNDLLDTAQAIASSRGTTSTPSFTVQGQLVSQGELFSSIEQTLQNIIATTGRQPVPLGEQGDEDTTDVEEVTPEATEEPSAEPTEDVSEEPMAEATEEVTPVATEATSG